MALSPMSPESHSTTPTNTPLKTPCDEEPMNPLLESVLFELTQAEKAGDRTQTIEAWNALGLIRLHTQRNPSEALRCHQHALTLCTQSMETSNTCADIGLCYERLGQDEEALKCYEKAYSLLRANNVSDAHPRVIGLKRVLARLGRM